MTRDEIRLVVFVMLAVALGSIVKWWRNRDPRQPQVLHIEERKSGWADPPYVFQSKAMMEGMRKEGEKAPAKPNSQTQSVPASSR